MFKRSCGQIKNLWQYRDMRASVKEAVKKMLNCGDINKGTDYLSRGLEQEYGVPYFLYPSPMGIAHNDEWLRQIGKLTGKEEEVEKLIKEEHEVWVPKMQTIQERFSKLKGDGEKVQILGALGQGGLLAQIPYN